MKFELSRLPQHNTASIVAELRRVATIVPEHLPLTRTRFNKNARVDASTVGRHFGGWSAALAEAGLSHRYSGRTVSTKMKSQQAREMTDRQLIAELQRVAAELGTQVLTQAEFNSHSAISASAISRRLSSWNTALATAGLKPVNMGRRYTEDDYFENLLAVWTHYGRQPKYAEMNNPPSVITSGAYEKRWGSWTRALTAFVDRVNSDASGESMPQSEEERATDILPRKILTPEDQRKISLGLRYDVLKRDNFKCAVCGNSPATDSKCKLHVDHVVPFSRGGRTIESNLRTLCDACNIGKSNKV